MATENRTFVGETGSQVYDGYAISVIGLQYHQLA